MHYTTHGNKPYDLATEHGRAQSYAHGEYGAFLVRTIEQSLENTQEQDGEIIANLVEAVGATVDWSAVQGEELSEQLVQFQKELGCRDAEVFLPICAAYEEERKRVEEVVKELKDLVNKICKICKVEESAL